LGTPSVCFASDFFRYENQSGNNNRLMSAPETFTMQGRIHRGHGPDHLIQGSRVFDEDPNVPQRFRLALAVGHARLVPEAYVKLGKLYRDPLRDLRVPTLQAHRALMFPAPGRATLTEEIANPEVSPAKDLP